MSAVAFATGDLHFPVSNTKPVLARSIDAALASILEGERDGICRRWLPFATLATAPSSRIDLSQVEQAWLKNHVNIRLGAEPFDPPFTMVRDNGKFEGLAADYLKLIAARTGWNVELQTSVTIPESPVTLDRNTHEPEKVKVHDCLDAELGKAIPYGVYDISENQGWVSVGIDHDTARLATEAIARGWKKMGSKRYGHARELLITVEGGGSNGSRCRLWKVALQELATKHLSTQGSNPHHPISLQLDSRFYHRCTDAYQLLVQASLWVNQEANACRLSQSAQGPPQEAINGDLGRSQDTPQSLRARLPRQPGWAYPNRLFATLRTRPQSSRVSVGLAQATRTGQLLPQQPERFANDRTQQAQECAKATHDHRSLLGTSESMVMS